MNKRNKSNKSIELIKLHSDEIIEIGSVGMDINQLLDTWNSEQIQIKKQINLIDQLVDIKYIAGADISWDKNQIDAIGCIVIHHYLTLDVIAEFSIKCKIHIPYKAGYLAYREVPVYLKLIEIIKNFYPELLPQIILLDGNGVWHPRGCGAASYLGVKTNIPTIGVSKNVLYMDLLGKKEIQELMKNATEKDTFVEVINNNELIGYAYNSSGSIKRPIYVSAGHAISQEKSIEIVRHMNKYRISEPIRYADKLSRTLLQKK